MLSELKAFKETFKIKRPKVSYIVGFVFTLLQWDILWNKNNTYLFVCSVLLYSSLLNFLTFCLLAVSMTMLSYSVQIIFLLCLNEFFYSQNTQVLFAALNMYIYVYKGVSLYFMYLFFSMYNVLFRYSQWHFSFSLYISYKTTKVIS